MGSIPGWGRFPGGGHDNPTPVFLPGESRQAAPIGVAQTQTRLKQLSTRTEQQRSSAPAVPASLARPSRRALP